MTDAIETEHDAFWFMRTGTDPVVRLRAEVDYINKSTDVDYAHLRDAYQRADPKCIDTDFSEFERLAREGRSNQTEVLKLRIAMAVDKAPLNEEERQSLLTRAINLSHQAYLQYTGLMNLAAVNPRKYRQRAEKIARHHTELDHPNWAPAEYKTEVTDVMSLRQIAEKKILSVLPFPIAEAST